MRTLKLTLAYDGTAYAGWQKQPNCTTVQGALEATLKRVTDEEIATVASGRTDAGVHALGQVVSFRTNSHLATEVLQRALDAELPEDVAVLQLAEAADEFHAIRDAVRKRYRYLIHDAPIRNVFGRRYAWHYGRRLDTDTMQRAAECLVGTHDFRSFESDWPNRTTSVRTIFELSVARESALPLVAGHPATKLTSDFGEFSRSAQRLFVRPRGSRRATGRAASSAVRPKGSSFDPEALDERRVEPRGRARAATDRSPASTEQRRDLIAIEVEADGFLYNMVRSIVGTLVEVGRGAHDEEWVAEVLRTMDRKAAGPTAPPLGLFLVRVDYAS